MRSHEAAHQAAAGSLGGPVSFTYVTGPDGRSYAVGGEVPVDLSPGRTPEETIARAEQIRSAALAPADPSAQDFAVAAAAAQMEAAARQQLTREQQAIMLAQLARGGAEPLLGPKPGGEVDEPRSFGQEAPLVGEAASAVVVAGAGSALALEAPTPQALDPSVVAAHAITVLQSRPVLASASQATLMQVARLATGRYAM